MDDFPGAFSSSGIIAPIQMLLATPCLCSPDWVNPENNTNASRTMLSISPHRLARWVWSGRHSMEALEIKP
ncbi:MAG: hypothetical protein SH848_08245 [Saprospiraceae bacterium]|nr:hypothetical protein [Saprospiraceae bacterium]